MEAQRLGFDGFFARWIGRADPCDLQRQLIQPDLLAHDRVLVLGPLDAALRLIVCDRLTFCVSRDGTVTRHDRGRAAGALLHRHNLVAREPRRNRYWWAHADAVPRPNRNRDHPSHRDVLVNHPTAHCRIGRRQHALTCVLPHFLKRI